MRKPLSYISATALTIALSACATTPRNVTPEQYASMAEIREDSLTGMREVLAPKYNPRDGRSDISSNSRLRSSMEPDGSALMDIALGYTTPTPEPFDARLYDRVLWAGGLDAEIVEFGDQVVGCEEIVDTRVYDYGRYGYGGYTWGGGYGGHRSRDRGRDRDQRGRGRHRGDRDGDGEHRGDRDRDGDYRGGGRGDRDRDGRGDRDRDGDYRGDRDRDGGGRGGGRGRGGDGSGDRDQRPTTPPVTRPSRPNVDDPITTPDERDEPRVRPPRTGGIAGTPQTRRPRPRIEPSAPPVTRSPATGSRPVISQPSTPQVSRPAPTRPSRPAPRPTPTPTPPPSTSSAPAVTPAPAPSRPARTSPRPRPDTDSAPRPARPDRPDRQRRAQADTGFIKVGYQKTNYPYGTSTYAETTARYECRRVEYITVRVPGDRMENAELFGLDLVLQSRAGDELTFAVPSNYVLGFQMARARFDM